MQRISARIVVGMPVFNAEQTVSDAIASVLAYPKSDMKLLISDNASTDNTQKICRRYADKDGRVVLVTQSQNIGAEANFDYVLSAAHAQYFMWAAADDIRSPNLLEQCAAFLDAHDDYVGATCPVRFRGADFNSNAMGDSPIEYDDPHERMLAFFNGIHANGRFYSLLRRAALSAWPSEPKSYLGSDWTLVLHLLRAGKFARLDSGWVELGTEGISNSLAIFSRYRRNAVNWVLPFAELSRAALREFRDAGALMRVRLLVRLMKINVSGLFMQARHEITLLRQKREIPPSNSRVR